MPSAATTIVSLVLRVLVMDRAGTSPETLAEAEEHAARVYRRSGIEIIWHNVQPGVERAQRVPTVPADGRQPIVVVNVMPASMEAGANVPPGVLGVATPDDLVVHILQGRVERLAEATGTRLPEVLGYTLAHEIGHVLLPLDRHALTGIMRETLDMKHVAQGGTLWFSKGQALHMREEIGRLRQPRDVGAVAPPNGPRPVWPR